MKIIVPMAGIGKRMRPHTLTIPKPLLPIAGKPIVQRLVEDIAGVCEEKIDEIAFIIGDFGKEVENDLLEIAKNLGATGKIYHQAEALGTAHAVLCAADSLEGKTIVAFADTLFYADFKLEGDKDGIIWVEKVEDPRAFGVVKLNNDGAITDFIEKPEEFVSDLAIIGIYYFRDGAGLRKEIEYLIENDTKEKGEFQLTNALENMKAKGLKFYPGKVEEWLDCGNKDATVFTNRRVLDRQGSEIASNVLNTNSVIIEPCYIGDHVKLTDSVVGPHVSIGHGSELKNVVIENSIVQDNSIIESDVIGNSMIGNNVRYKGRKNELSLGDYNQVN